MAYFAHLNQHNIVLQVIVIGDDDIIDKDGNQSENVGISFCKKLFGESTEWKQTFHDGRRGNYAGIGMTYMSEVSTMGVASTDVFIPQQRYPSWSIDPEIPRWVSPLGDPPELTDSEIAEGAYYSWDENSYQQDNSTGWSFEKFVIPEPWY